MNLYGKKLKRVCCSQSINSRNGGIGQCASIEVLNSCTLSSTACDRRSLFKKLQRFTAREGFAHDRILNRCVEIRKFIMPEGFALRRIRFALWKLHNSLVSERFALRRILYSLRKLHNSHAREGFARRRILYSLRKLHNSLAREGFAHDPELDRTGEIAIAQTDSSFTHATFRSGTMMSVLKFLSSHVCWSKTLRRQS